MSHFDAGPHFDPHAPPPDGPDDQPSNPLLAIIGVLAAWLAVYGLLIAAVWPW